MKKLVLFTLVALSMLATARTTQKDAPIPGCSPCPFVR